MNKKSQSITVLAIFSIGFIAMIIGTITPAIQAIGNAFPNVPFTTLMLVSTLPSLVSIPFSVLAGSIVGKAMKYRTLTMLALLILAVAGIAPYWLTDWTMVLIARAVFGIGMGLISPIPAGLIFNLVAPEKQANIMGLNGVVSNIGGMVLQFLGGVMATIGWNLSFLVHSFAFLSLVIVAIFLPEPEKRQIPADAVGEAPKSAGLPAVVWVWSAAYAIMTVMMYPSLTNISTVFQEMGLNPAMAATALMLMTVGGMVMGAVFGKVFEAIAFKCIPSGFVLLVVSQFLMATGQNFMMFAVAEVLLGIGMGLAGTAIMMLIGSSVTPDKSPLAMSFLMACMSIGGFLSAFIYAGVMGTMGITSMRFQYWVGTAGFAVYAVVTFFVYMRKSAAPPVSGPSVKA
ncbi:sugar efflux transporter [Oxobacter pfennigii]|uniref:Sugar efflux transporter n=1 Tax=Oxobacter pfennigii TaxID=36849 RepID=A0A0P8W9P2_9CLOT|nr:MFS transporter [Oxobacter pfennigii]KPU44406.1 sugar efflux transporter [Oxobacter pfennigii]